MRGHRQRVIVYPTTTPLVFSSLARAAKALGIQPAVIKQRIEDGQEYKGYTFDILDPENIEEEK